MKVGSNFFERILSEDLQVDSIGKSLGVLLSDQNEWVLDLLHLVQKRVNQTQFILGEDRRLEMKNDLGHFRKKLQVGFGLIHYYYNRLT